MVFTQPHGEQLHTTWPPHMRIVPRTFWSWKHCEELCKEKYGNYFPNLVLALPSILEI